MHNWITINREKGKIEMWPDPTNLYKGKPRYLGETPSNLSSCIFSIVAGFTIISGYILISYTPWFQKKIDKHTELAQIKEDKKEYQAFLADPIINSLITRLKDTYDN